VPVQCQGCEKFEYEKNQKELKEVSIVALKYWVFVSQEELKEVKELRGDERNYACKRS
jgi:hypothetical protein